MDQPTITAGSDTQSANTVSPLKIAEIVSFNQSAYRLSKGEIPASHFLSALSAMMSEEGLLTADATDKLGDIIQDNPGNLQVIKDFLVEQLGARGKQLLRMLSPAGGMVSQVSFS